jgi:tetratricopeptide (TPR) repeat protein
VLRICRVKTRQLIAWEKAGLFPTLPEGEQYSFEHLSRLHTLGKLRSKRLPLRRLRAGIEAMQASSGLQNALNSATAVRQGSRVAFRHQGSLVEPVSRQLAFDFGTNPLEAPQLIRTEPKRNTAADAAREAAQIQEMFVRAVQLEEKPATIADAVKLYEEILVLRPDHSAACINLGTIFYNQRKFGRAEDMYRRATAADPDYALAFFDLGNVLDEMLRLDEAIAAYRRAIEIIPQYADAHYNLALAYERTGERRRALRHWMAYARLDPVGPWATHAKGQARKILSMERLGIVSRGGRVVSEAG